MNRDDLSLEKIDALRLNVIRIEPTRYFDVKTEHSTGDVQIDPELMSLFRGYAALAGSAAS